MLSDTPGELYNLFASVLEYPTTALCVQVDVVASILHASHPQSEVQITIFQEYVNCHTLAALEELYTRTFDLQGVCCPYVGHQLFGESFKRSQFMACLNHAYHARQFSSGAELPDHVSVILRFLALGTGDEFTQALVCEGLMLAVTKMINELAPHPENPYRSALQAIQDVLSHAFQTTPESIVGSATGEVTHA
jgi:nitrate reductase molybdenum cofactor assembly chaperone NarJ/NarW